MLEIGQVLESLFAKGVVCVEDVYEDRAVRLVMNGNDIDAYIKRKGEDEIRSRYDTDSVQETIHELHNKEITVEEYNSY